MEIKIDKIIRLLEDAKRAGGKTVSFKGTLLVIENGNSIVITTENQI